MLEVYIMPKGKNKKYSKKQMKIVRMAAPFDKITGATLQTKKKKRKKYDEISKTKRFSLDEKGNSYKLMKGIQTS